MLTPEQINIFLPKTAQDIQAIAEDIHQLMQQLPDYEPNEFREFITWLEEVPTIFTMVYVDGVPAGFVRIDTTKVNGSVGRKCLEFHGGVLPEFEGSGLSEIVAPIAIEKAFERHPKQKKMIVILNEPDPKSAALLTRIGFERKEEVTAKGQRVYRLYRSA